MTSESRAALVVGAGPGLGGAEERGEEGLLPPDAIAESYWQLHTQPRSAWTHELDLRPHIEPW